ncbi:helix-turn-helix domain-containing protein [Halostella sp. JP-L12]|uniref:helix-turn-helix transcriptional regulator n=1 Tax=Halostella TaxID=1843185 RepID=UPI0013CE95DE|nr:MULTISPECIES: helix-turn-helix domain-containing protein [Halostella]NHN46237.1 helix-turn-helix domain-containing protein [Halostella sp. JP-L12]
MELARRALALIGVLLILTSVGTPVSGLQAAQDGITDVELTGSAVVSEQNDSSFVWTDESFNLSVSFSGDESRAYEVCAYRYHEGNQSHRLGCTETAAQNATVTFPVDKWPVNETGPQTVQIVLSTGDGAATDLQTKSVTVIEKEGDLDGDGLSNKKEVDEGLNMTNADMDQDGLTDGAEVENYGTDPTKADSDGDGLRDGLELQLGTDPTDGSTVAKLSAGGLLLGVGLVVGWFLLRRRRTGEEGTVEAAETAPEAADEPLLTDEQRVIQLLEENGGRMKQAAIVNETEWSKAKVSRLLSDMVDEGKIEKLSIGRENIIHLEGHGPEAAKPPYSE